MAKTLVARADVTCKCLLAKLRFKQGVPSADLLAFGFLHFLPMVLFLFSATVLAQSNPTNHLFTLHSTPVINGNHQCDIRELKEGHLESKGLLVDWIGLTTSNGRLTAGHLLTHRIEKKELSVCI